MSRVPTDQELVLLDNRSRRQCSLHAGSTGEGDAGVIVDTVTRLLEDQRHMMEVQVQALASQSVPPLRKFTGEDVNTDEGSIDLWIEQFEERADGWNKEQKLFQLASVQSACLIYSHEMMMNDAG